MIKAEIKSIVERESYNGGFDFSDISINEIRKENNHPHFEMKTSLSDKKTDINYDSSYDPEKTKIIIRDGARHEINHHGFRGYKGCPKNIDNHAYLIYEPIMDVLSEKGFSAEDGHYIANALEDTILHDDLSKGFALDGITEFFSDVAESSENFTSFYEAHVRLNMFLFGNKHQKNKLNKYFTKDKEERKKILEAINGFLSESGINEFNQDIDEKQIRDKEKIREYLLNENNWKKISDAYAKNMSNLMQPGYAQSLMNHNGAGTKGRESEDSSEQGNEFDREMKTKNFKRARMQKAYSENTESPSWIDKFDALDLIYESLAKKLIIKADTFTKQMHMPISWYGSREFDYEKDDFKHINISADDSGNLEITKKKYHENIPLDVKISQHGFPRARFVLMDSSGSMKLNPSGNEDVGSEKIIPWGNNSRYHYALLAWYGFLEYLRQNHLLNQSAVDFAGFSDTTSIGNGLLEAKKVALSPQFGNTKLDMEKVKEFFKGRGNLIFSISDGSVDNWSEIKNNYLNGAKKHYYFHLQLGEETKMYNDLKKQGLYADKVFGNSDLADKTIDLTDRILRGNK